MKAGQTIRVEVQANDRDPEGKRLSLRRGPLKVSHPKRVRVKVQKGKVVVKARDFAAGNVSIKYRVADPQGEQTWGTLKVRIRAQAPVARTDRASTKSGKRVAINVMANDYDPNKRKIKMVRSLNSRYGKTWGRKGGVLVFQPNRNVFGTVKLRYKIKNSAGVSKIGLVYVNVAAPPAAPINVERNLARLGLPVGGVDGYYNDSARRAICAWRDIMGRSPHRGLPSRSEAAQIAATRSLPRPHSAMVTGMNVNKTCQAGFWVSNGRYKRIMPVTTGMAGFETRSGYWRIFYGIPTTWEESNLYPGAMMYRSMYFSGGQALHGSATDALVGPYPRSHGCVRMLHRDIDALRAAGFSNGGAVRVYGGWRG